MRTLGLIAGNGIFPIEVAKMSRHQGIRTIAVAHLGETDPSLTEFAESVTWIKIGELQRMIDVFRNAQVEAAAMAGGISRLRLKDSFAPDQRALAMLARIGRFSDDAVLRGVAAELEAEGIPVIDPVPMLDGILAQGGLLAGPEPSPAQMADLRLAFAITRALGAFDVGQAVAVRDGVVAAVEATEGTDAALRRAATLCGKGLVVAKAAKPSQDLRFDRPAIGPGTIELLRELQAGVIGVEAGTAMLLERDSTLERARTFNITVYGYV
ncbi:MAG TPA: UDP-2,3-diacylglucosamine diphosphatase LpxI [Candidatus Binataceae bacterium]|nr:UDP-2,3-diacylglucosamine diphosphatase LpxI [Candidatus Binataceae bacterium]